MVQELNERLARLREIGQQLGPQAGAAAAAGGAQPAGGARGAVAAAAAASAAWWEAAAALAADFSLLPDEEPERREVGERVPRSRACPSANILGFLKTSTIP